MKYELSRQAVLDIEEIIRYTDEKFGFSQTDKYLEGLFYSFELLTDNPKMGHVWKGEKRRYVYRMHDVYYRILPDCVFVTQIRYSSREK